jgi:hypothetical protein
LLPAPLVLSLLFCLGYFLPLTARCILDAFNPGSNYTLVLSAGRQSIVYTLPVVWRPSTLTTTQDPHLGREEFSLVELWKFARPYLLVAAGWGLGVVMGVLGLIWLLR